MNLKNIVLNEKNDWGRQYMLADVFERFINTKHRALFMAVYLHVQRIKINLIFTTLGDGQLLGGERMRGMDLILLFLIFLLFI